METTQESLDAVNYYLIESEKHGLLTETVTFALIHMQDNPSLTVSEAIYMGYLEFIK